jgi:hypothetical protein
LEGLGWSLSGRWGDGGEIREILRLQRYISNISPPSPHLLKKVTYK